MFETRKMTNRNEQHKAAWVESDLFYLTLHIDLADHIWRGLS